jgi:hypothetical protein
LYSKGIATECTVKVMLGGVMLSNGNVMRGWVKGIVLFCTVKKAKAGYSFVLRSMVREKQGSGTHSKGGAWQSQGIV